MISSSSVICHESERCSSPSKHSDIPLSFAAAATIYTLPEIRDKKVLFLIPFKYTNSRNLNDSLFLCSFCVNMEVSCDFTLIFRSCSFISDFLLVEKKIKDFCLAVGKQNHLLTSEVTLLYVSGFFLLPSITAEQYLIYSVSPLSSLCSPYNTSSMCKCMWIVPSKLTLSQITVCIFMFQEIGALSSFVVCKFNRYCLCLISPMLFICVCCESLYESLKGHMCTTTDLTALQPNCTQNHLRPRPPVFI